MRLGTALAVAWIAAPGCAELSPDMPADPTAAAVRIELVGCLALERDGTCVRPPAGPATRCENTRGDRERLELTLWIEAATPAQWSIRVDGANVTTAAFAVSGGQRYRLGITPEVERIEVQHGGRVVRTFTLADAETEPEALQRARDARTWSLDDPDRADVSETLHRELARLSPRHHAVALDVLADLHFQRAGSAPVASAEPVWREVLDRSEEAIAWAQSHDDPDRAACHARRGLFVALERLGDADAIERFVGHLDRVRDASPAAVAQSAYYRGLLAQRTGDLRRASADFRTAHAEAGRLGETTLALGTTQQLAAVLANLGREQEVAALFDEAQADAASLSCVEWVRLLNNRAWAGIALAELGRRSEDPIADLDLALAVLGGAEGSDSGCHDAVLQEHARLNLALAVLREGWVGQAEALAAELPPPEDAAPGTEFWRQQLDQRLALARAERGELVEWALRRGDPAIEATPERAWLSASDRGHMFEALGLPDDALQAYARAEDALQARMAELDFDVGRDRLLLGRQVSAGRSVALSTARGDAAGALCVARRARARTSSVLDRSARIAALAPDQRRAWLRALAAHDRARRHTETLASSRWSIPVDQSASFEAQLAAAREEVRAAARDAWRVLGPDANDERDPCARLPRPAPGELALTYFPVASWSATNAPTGAPTWVGFAFDAQGRVDVAEILSLPAANAERSAWSHALLDPFRDAITTAKALRILPTAELWSLPFAALPWGDDVLLAHAPITYGLDLASESLPSAAVGSQRALVVGDPHGDLPQARREAEIVGAALRRANWDVTVLVGEQARADRVREEIASVDLVHYAGHGQHAGVEGWSSALRLADDGALDVIDVLALPRVPPVVLLPACDTAPSREASLGGDMNLARAFLSTGAREVVAALGEIDDAFAVSLAEALYAQGPPSADSLAADLRRAVLQARAAAPEDAAWWRVVALAR